MIAENQTFTGKRIQLDGSSFTNCRFNECRLVFNGLVGFELVGSHFQDCRYDFEGPARETIQFMRRHLSYRRRFGSPDRTHLRRYSASTYPTTAS
jgi:hypothetical protein